jgi:hypothetical protein
MQIGLLAATGLCLRCCHLCCCSLPLSASPAATPVSESYPPIFFFSYYRSCRTRNSRRISLWQQKFWSSARALGIIIIFIFIISNRSTYFESPEIISIPPIDDQKQAAELISLVLSLIFCVSLNLVWI